MPLRILIIDDDEDDYLITGEYLRQVPGYEMDIHWCYRYEEAIDKLCSGAYDLYFTDYRLGAYTGIDLLREAALRNCEEAVILLTGKGNREIDMEAMQLGAMDYLVKTELNAEKMERTLRYALERIASTRALKANERKYRSIFEKTKDIVFLADEMLDFKDINKAASDLLGCAREELLRSNLCDYIEDTRQKSFLQRALSSYSRSINDWEVVLVGPSGTRHICLLSASTESGGDGQDYVQGIIHDITEMKREEQATLHMEKQAAAGRLVRTLAHEVRNPLNNITLSAEELAKEDIGEYAQEYVRMIQRNSHRISNLISELLQTSKPGESRLKPVPLRHVTDEVLAAAEDRLRLKRIRLEQDYPAGQAVVMADAEKLKLALLNIVINAIEAMEDGVGVLRISISAVDGDGTLLEITDNGCGISKENLSHLYEPYFTQKKNGMGLGLAFTMGILNAHQARIEAASELGVFTTFTITFPEPDDFQAEPKGVVEEGMTVHER